MSRHKTIKKQLQYADYDDGYDDYDDEDYYGVSPSPSSASYMYNARKPSTSLWDSVKKASSSSSDANAGRRNEATASPLHVSSSDEESAVAQSALQSLIGVLGEQLAGHSQAHCLELLRSLNYSVEAALDQLLDISAVQASPSAHATDSDHAEPSTLRESNQDVFALDDLVAAPSTTSAVPPTKQANGSAGKSPARGGVFVLGPTTTTVTASPASSSSTTMSASQAVDADEVKVVDELVPASATSSTSTPSFTSPRSKQNFKQRTNRKQQDFEALLARERSAEQKKTSGEKRHFNLVVIGHVDAGKSTINGHLLYLTGRVSEKVIRGYEKQSKEAGKGSFSFAWVMDEHAEERARGVTVDVGVNSFETEHCAVTLLDAPGHRDFIPNMITGASQADMAVLVLDATAGEFESGFSVDGQTREHAVLARSLGVRQLVVAVNKMDVVDWSKERYEEVCAQVKGFLRQTGFKDRQLLFLPCSGLTGANLMPNSLESIVGSAAAWYSGSSLIETIDQFDPSFGRNDLFHRPLRLAVSDVYKSRIQSVATLAGKVEAGNVMPTDRLLLVPSNEIVTVKSILSHEKPLEFAQVGQNVDLSVSGLDLSLARVGDVLCDPEHPLTPSTKIRAQIIVLVDLRIPIIKGTSCMFHCHVTSTAASITRLVALVDRASGASLRKKPRCLLEGQAGIVDIETTNPVCIELYSEYQQLGRFLLRSEGRSIAAGIVIDKKRR